MQKSVQTRENRIISAMSGQFQSGLPIFKRNKNINRNLTEWLVMKIREVKENKKQFLSVLLLADEQENMIDRYLKETLCMCLMITVIKAKWELLRRNTTGLLKQRRATEPEYEGKGYAKALIDFIVKEYLQLFGFTVGTGIVLTVPCVGKVRFCSFLYQTEVFYRLLLLPRYLKVASGCGYGDF